MDGFPKRPLRLLDRALALYERAGQADPSLRAEVAIRSAKARANKARILTLLGGFDEGIRLFEEARDSFEQHGETVSAVRAERFIASVYAGQGHYTRALRVYSRVHRLVMQAGLADIAVICGFVDQSHFTRVFTRFEGDSPGRWRQTHR